jgi:hypothetical protein
MIELALVMYLSLLARDEAALRYDESVQRYIEAVHSGSPDAGKLRDGMGALHVALRAILERERMREIDLAIDVRTLRGAGTPETDEELRVRDEALRLLRAERERFLARRTVIEREQQAAVAAAVVTSQPTP